MVASQNGWKANDKSVIVSIDVPGGRLTCRSGAVATIFKHLVTRFNNEVEGLVWPGNWGYAERVVRGGTDLSNHASGTAIDLNAPRHPLAKVGTFSAGQVNTIKGILAFYEGIVRWGGMYDGRKDEMHFEINDGVTEAQVARIAAKCGGAPVTAGPSTPAAPVQAPSGSFPLPRNEYFGLITGPRESHGGANAQEREWVKKIQQQLIRIGAVPGITNPNSGWADGKFEKATADAVTRFQRAYMPGTTRFGEVWWDDWTRLLG